MRKHLSAILLGTFTASAMFYALHMHRMYMRHAVQAAIDTDVQTILHAQDQAAREKAKAHLRQITDQSMRWE